MNNFILEELSINHWPAQSTSFFEGWILNFSEGYTKRANCIHPIYNSAVDVDEQILQCQALYTANQLPTIFKLTPFVKPAYLDELLHKKGYLIANESLVLTTSLEHIKVPASSRCSVNYLQEPSCEWLDFHAQVSQLSDEHKAMLNTIVTNIKHKKLIVTLQYNGHIVAAGLGVLERGHIGIYNLATKKDYRNKGYATGVLLHLLNWGKEKGASTSYILVDAQNRAANHLYDKLGYKEQYKYWYRIKPN